MADALHQPQSKVAPKKALPAAATAAFTKALVIIPKKTGPPAKRPASSGPAVSGASAQQRLAGKRIVAPKTGPPPPTPPPPSPPPQAAVSKAKAAVRTVVRSRSAGRQPIKAGPPLLKVSEESEVSSASGSIALAPQERRGENDSSKDAAKDADPVEASLEQRRLSLESEAEPSPSPEAPKVPQQPAEDDSPTPPRTSAASSSRAKVEPAQSPASPSSPPVPTGLSAEVLFIENFKLRQEVERQRLRIEELMQRLSSPVGQISQKLASHGANSAATLVAGTAFTSEASQPSTPLPETVPGRSQPARFAAAPVAVRPPVSPQGGDATNGTEEVQVRSATTPGGFDLPPPQRCLTGELSTPRAVGATSPSTRGASSVPLPQRTATMPLMASAVSSGSCAAQGGYPSPLFPSVVLGSVGPSPIHARAGSPTWTSMQALQAVQAVHVQAVPYVASSSLVQGRFAVANPPLSPVLVTSSAKLPPGAPPQSLGGPPAFQVLGVAGMGQPQAGLAFSPSNQFGRGEPIGVSRAQK